MTKQTRCEAVIVQVIATTYDDANRPVSEQTSQPVKVFRAGARDFWAEVDKAVNAMHLPAPSTPVTTEGPRKPRNRA